MKRVTNIESIEEITEALNSLPAESGIFLDKSFAISNVILEYMKLNGWLQKDLAEKMSKSEAEISKLLSGNHNYTLRTLSKIEAVLLKEVIFVPELKKNAESSETPFCVVGTLSVNKDVSQQEENDWRDSDRVLTKGNDDSKKKRQNLQVAA